MAAIAHYTTLDGVDTKEGWSAPPSVLPEQFAKKAANRSPTAAEIRERESRVERNREAIIQARVDKQKKHHERVEQLKERKRKREMVGGCEKYTLDAEAGTTVAGWKAEGVSAPDGLSKKKRPSADEIKEREALVESNRTQFLASRVQAAKDHLTKVAETKQRAAEFSENMSLLGDKRTKAAILPPHLEKRLAELKAKGETAEDILGREARVQANRQKVLDSRVTAARLHSEMKSPAKMETAC